MSLYRRFDTEGHPSFITTNTSERRPFFSSPAACKLLIRILYDVRQETGLRLLAFAIMPDHVHLIAVSPPAGLGRAMQLLKGRFARRYNQLDGRSGGLWQSRYHERTLLGDDALSNAIEYVHQNPVVAGLVEQPEKYAWSSANQRYATDLQEYLGSG